VDISTIKEKLTSSDVDVLKQSLDYLNQRLALERSRSDRAETRATSLLVVGGILAGFVVVFIESFREGKLAEDVLTLILFSSSLLLLAKSLFYAVKALWALKGNELTADLPYDFQSLSPMESIKEELAWKIWEYYELLPVSNQRLFWVNRSQRNLLFAFTAFLCLGAESFASVHMNIVMNTSLAVSLAVILGISIILLDPISERFGNLWTFK
jgi:hypothetical protein